METRASAVGATARTLVDGKVVTHATLDAALAAIRRDEPTWIDLKGRTPEAEWLLGPEGLALHPLVIEDIFADRERPKLEEFEEYLYVIVHAPRVVKEGPNEMVALTELDLVLGDAYVLTHHGGESQAVNAVREDLDRGTRGLQRGVAYVFHAILDHCVDDFVPVLDRLDEAIDQLETDVLETNGDDTLARIFSYKRQLQQLRRASSHQKEVLHRLGRGEFDRIPQALVPFFRDVHDHFVRVSDLAESYRDLVASALEAHLSVQSNRMNAIMKQLTLTATIFLPLSFVVGFYGMNFEHMPELHLKWAYPAVIGVLGTIVVLMLAFYRRKKWI
jgi:magnesium transporter